MTPARTTAAETSRTKLLIPERVPAMTRSSVRPASRHGRAGAKDHHLLRPRPARRRCGDRHEQSLRRLVRTERQATPRPFAFKCTASVGGAQYLADLRGASRSYFIATTVDLLTTGVDVPAVRTSFSSNTSARRSRFTRWSGAARGSIAATGKLMFRVYDFTNATRLFGEEFETKWQPRERGRARTADAARTDAFKSKASTCA